MCLFYLGWNERKSGEKEEQGDRHVVGEQHPNKGEREREKRVFLPKKKRRNPHGERGKFPSFFLVFFHLNSNLLTPTEPVWSTVESCFSSDETPNSPHQFFPTLFSASITTTIRFIIPHLGSSIGIDSLIIWAIIWAIFFFFFRNNRRMSKWDSITPRAAGGTFNINTKPSPSLWCRYIEKWWIERSTTITCKSCPPTLKPISTNVLFPCLWSPFDCGANNCSTSVLLVFFVCFNQCFLSFFAIYSYFFGKSVRSNKNGNRKPLFFSGECICFLFCRYFHCVCHACVGWEE